MGLRRRSSGRVYEVGRRIAVGGMGEVYEGEAPDLKRRVAIKRVLKSHDARDLKELFFREVAVAAALEHPNVVEVLDAGIAESDLYLIMDFVDGASLAEIHDALRLAGRKMPIEVACGLVAQVARGLAHAHERAMPDGTPLGIIHRDIALENVLISRAGLPKLVDFGLATLAGHDLTNPGTIRGRPRFLSPEQARGERLDARSDIFSLGALTFEVIAGEPLYREQTLASLLWRVTEGRYDPLETRLPDLDPDLLEILRSALAVDPRDRIRSARELERALDAFRAARGMRVDSGTIARLVAELEPWILELRAEKNTEGPGALENTTLVLAADRLDTSDLGSPGPREVASATPLTAPPPRSTPSTTEYMKVRSTPVPRVAHETPRPARTRTPAVERTARATPRPIHATDPVPGPVQATAPVPGLLQATAQATRTGEAAAQATRPGEAQRPRLEPTPKPGPESKAERVPTPKPVPKPPPRRGHREGSWLLFVGLVLAGTLLTFFLAWGRDAPTPANAVTERQHGTLVLPGAAE